MRKGFLLNFAGVNQGSDKRNWIEGGESVKGGNDSQRYVRGSAAVSKEKEEYERNDAENRSGVGSIYDTGE